MPFEYTTGSTDSIIVVVSNYYYTVEVLDCSSIRTVDWKCTAEMSAMFGGEYLQGVTYTL